MTETDRTAAATPREIAERLRLDVLGIGSEIEWAEDGVYETPFALPGVPQRFEGRAAIQEHLGSRQNEGMRSAMDIADAEITVHETADPEVVVFEIEVHGTSVPTGAPFRFTSTIGVIRVRDGKLVHWRDYPNFLGGAEAAGALPQLALMLGGGQLS